MYKLLTSLNVMLLPILFNAAQLRLFSKIFISSKTPKLSEDRNFDKLLSVLISIGFLQKDSSGALRLPVGMPFDTADNVYEFESFIIHRANLCRQILCNWGETAEIAKLESIDVFCEAMDFIAKNRNIDFNMYIPADKEVTILDAGCGGGYYSSQILEQNPYACVTLLDLKTIIAYVKEKFSKFGQRRCNFVSHDLLLPNSELGKFDVIILSSVIHAYNDVDVQTILNNLSGHLKDEGLLLILDYFPLSVSSDCKASVFSTLMSITTKGGRVYDKSEFLDIMSSCKQRFILMNDFIFDEMTLLIFKKEA